MGHMSTSSEAIRVLIVDDSAMIRGFLAKILDAEPDIQVVSTAANGELALNQLRRQTADVIVLDVEMPVMDGIEALPRLQEVAPDARIIMASSVTQRGADITLTALSLGAADFIPKPSTGHAGLQAQAVSRDLIAKIRAHGSRPPSAQKTGASPRPRDHVVSPRVVPRIVAIGSSAGGPNALAEVLKGLDPEANQPILITQHMPPVFTQSLARHLSEVSKRPCKEAEEGDRLRPGHVFVAPGDYHLTVRTEGAAVRLHVNQEEKVSFCRPSVDVTFESVARVYGSSAVAVVLTGMGSDGCHGCRKIAEAGGTVLVQDRETSVVWGMPGAVQTAGLADAVLPLDRIGFEISRLLMAEVVG